MGRWIEVAAVLGLLAVSRLLVMAEMSSSESWEDDKMHESSDDTPRPSMGRRGHGDDGMHGRDDRKYHGSDDGMHGRDDRGMHGRDDRPYHRGGSSPDYTPWWVRRRSSRPSHPFSPMFPRAWGGDHPFMRRSPMFPWGRGSWGSRRSSSPFFPRHYDDLQDASSSSSPSAPLKSDSLLSPSDDSSTPSSGRGWDDRNWGIPSRRDSWGMGWPSRDRSWRRPFWWDESNFWRAGSPGWRSGWHDDDFRSRGGFPFFRRTWRDPWSSDRWGSRWGNRWGSRWGNRWDDDDFDSWSSREHDGDSDDWWWSSSGSRGQWNRPSPWGSSWGRGFEKYSSFDDSFDRRNAFNDPFSWLFGPRLLGGGVGPITAPPVTPVTPGGFPSTSPDTSLGDDGPHPSK